MAASVAAHLRTVSAPPLPLAVARIGEAAHPGLGTPIALAEHIAAARIGEANHPGPVVPTVLAEHLDMLAPVAVNAAHSIETRGALAAIAAVARASCALDCSKDPCHKHQHRQDPSSGDFAYIQTYNINKFDAANIRTMEMRWSERPGQPNRPSKQRSAPITFFQETNHFE